MTGVDELRGSLEERGEIQVRQVWLSYAGDCRHGLLGRIFGPGRDSLETVVEVVYDVDLDTTRARVEPTSQEDLAHVEQSSGPMRTTRFDGAAS